MCFLSDFGGVSYLWNTGEIETIQVKPLAQALPGTVKGCDAKYREICQCGGLSTLCTKSFTPNEWVNDNSKPTAKGTYFHIQIYDGTVGPFESTT